MNWNSLENEEIHIPINIDLLITDGNEVFVGFLDSMHDWRMSNQDSCEEIDFHVSHWMEFPAPPCF